jgi:hypothetical protein
MPVPKACQPIADQLESAVKVLEAIQSNPNYIDHSGPHPGKPNPGMLLEAKAEEKKIAQLSAELNACKKAHGVDPEELCTFSGTAKLTSAQGSGEHHFSMQLEFLESLESHPRHFFVQEFPPIHVTVGGHDLTITQTGGGHGHFDPSNGHVDLQIDLDVDAPSPGGHMDIDITLATNGDKTRLNSAGELTMAGKSNAHGSGIGFPDHIEVAMTAKGKITPHP